MSELPGGWVKSKVNELFASFSGGTPSKSTFAYWNGDIPWISSGEFTSDLIRAGSEFITKAGLENSSAKLCRPGSVIVVVRSGVLKHRLPVALVGDSVAINQDIKCFDSLNDDLNRWLYLYLRRSEREILSLNREGTTVQSVKSQTLQALDLPVPPLNEQRRIVAKLEKLLSRVEAAQVRLASIPGILKRFRQSVLGAACLGRLTVEWREKNGGRESSSTALAEIRKRREAEAKTDVQKKNLQAIFSLVEENDSARLPESWTYVRLSKLCTSFEYGTSAKSKTTGNIPVLRMGNIQGGEIDWSNLVFTSDKKEIERYALKPNTVLFNRTNSPELVGKTAIYRGERRAIFAGYLIRINPLPELNPEYLNFCLNTNYAREFCQSVKTDGVSQSNINAQKLGSFEIPLPPLIEQEEIVRRVRTLLNTAEALDARYLTAKAHVDKLSQSLLAKAFGGELVPQDPNDEPALALLEQIRTTRAAQPAKTKLKKKEPKMKVKDFSAESVRDIIREFPEATFSFSDLRAAIPGHYDSLKEVVFNLLAEGEPSIKQVFDENTQSMRFERTNQ